MRASRFAAGRTRGDYESDDYFRAAVERQFEIIGEALNRLLKIDPDTAARISEHRRIIGFRNVLIHGYDAVDHAITWRIIEEKLPVLLAELRVLLAAEPETSHSQPTAEREDSSGNGGEPTPQPRSEEDPP